MRSIQTVSFLNKVRCVNPISRLFLSGVVVGLFSGGFSVADEPTSPFPVQAVESLPSDWRAYLHRGEVLFRSGKIAESLGDFDKSLELNPAMAASFWQRGLSLYYAGKFQAGTEQFELHRTVNSSDVENPFWHFLCVAKLEGVDSARKKILPCGHDGRPPMMDILELIRGTKTFDEVEQIVEAIDHDSKPKAYDRFYGNYYLGLYLDAIGQPDKAELFLVKAVDEKLTGYMPDAARLHLELLRKGKLPRGKR
jgi:lipoprotein NlpI